MKALFLIGILTAGSYFGLPYIGHYFGIYPESFQVYQQYAENRYRMKYNKAMSLSEDAAKSRVKLVRRNHSRRPSSKNIFHRINYTILSQKINESEGIANFTIEEGIAYTPISIKSGLPTNYYVHEVDIVVEKIKNKWLVVAARDSDGHDRLLNGQISHRDPLF